MKRMIVIREASMATTTTMAIDPSVDGVKVEDLAQGPVMEDVEAATAAAMEVEREDTIPMATTMVEEEEIAVIAVIAVIAAVEVKGAAIAAMEEEEGKEEESTMATTTPMERVAVTGVTAVKRWRLQGITPD